MEVIDRPPLPDLSGQETPDTLRSARSTSSLPHSTTSSVRSRRSSNAGRGGSPPPRGSGNLKGSRSERLAPLDAKNSALMRDLQNIKARSDARVNNNGSQSPKSDSNGAKKGGKRLPTPIADKLFKASAPFLPNANSVLDLAIELPVGMGGVAGKSLTAQPVSGVAEVAVLNAQLETSRGTLSVLQKASIEKQKRLEQMKSDFAIEQRATLREESGEEKKPMLKRLEYLEQKLEDTLVNSIIKTNQNKTLSLLEQRASRVTMASQHSVDSLDDEMQAVEQECHSFQDGIFYMQASTKEKAKVIDEYIQGEQNMQKMQEQQKQWGSKLLKVMKEGEDRVKVQERNQNKIVNQIVNREVKKRNKVNAQRSAERAVVAMETMVKRRQIGHLMEAAHRIREHTGISDPFQLFQRMCEGNTSQKTVTVDLKSKIKAAREKITALNAEYKEGVEMSQRLQFERESSIPNRREEESYSDRIAENAERHHLAQLNLTAVTDNLFPVKLGVTALAKRIDHAVQLTPSSNGSGGSSHSKYRTPETSANQMPGATQAGGRGASAMRMDPSGPPPKPSSCIQFSTNLEQQSSSATLSDELSMSETYDFEPLIALLQHIDERLDVLMDVRGSKEKDETGSETDAQSTTSHTSSPPPPELRPFSPFPAAPSVALQNNQFNIRIPLADDLESDDESPSRSPVQQMPAYVW